MNQESHRFIGGECQFCGSSSKLKPNMWNPETPNDFSKFRATDFPKFLDWWERSHSNFSAFQFAGMFVEGVTKPFVEAIARGAEPIWIKTMMRWRLLSQWAYELGVPLAERLQRGLEAILPPDMAILKRFEITPEDIAEVPPSIRRAFVDGMKFSMGWIRKLSGDARAITRDIIAANTLRNSNPREAIALLEQVLRRDLVARDLGTVPTAAQIQQWVSEAKFSTLEAIAARAELISVTEGMRMINLGILNALQTEGAIACYVMPHSGSCPDCQRLIDGRVFRIETLKENLFSNFGAKKRDWVPALPQHPRCRHSPLPVPYKFKQAIASSSIPPEGVLLQWYGLPGGKLAMEALGLPEKAGWLIP